MSKKSKYYAVKIGKIPGIYERWEECKENVDGFAGAKYKSFSTIIEAEEYLAEKEALNKTIKNENIATKIKSKKIKKESIEQLEEYLNQVQKTFNFDSIPEDTIIAYVDGSYDASTQRYSYGAAMLTKKDKIRTDSGVGTNEEASSARNVAGELTGTMRVAALAAKEGYKKLIIYHDYIGISKWYKEEWKAESYCAKEYITFMKKVNLFITFEKVKSHTGDVLNEVADLLAKKALGMIS